MYVLVPDDVEFLARLREVENPLLAELREYGLTEIYLDQAELIRGAYEAWRDIDRQLPAALRWQELPSEEAPQDHEGYALHDPRGRQLTSLYALEVSRRNLDVLRACYTMLASAEQAGVGSLARAISNLQDAAGNENKRLVDGFRRVLEVLELRAPYVLVQSLKRVTPTGPEAPVLAITLSGDQYDAYKRLCEGIVSVLSAGDLFASVFHRQMYALYAS